MDDWYQTLRGRTVSLGLSGRTGRPATATHPGGRPGRRNAAWHRPATPPRHRLGQQVTGSDERTLDTDSAGKTMSDFFKMYVDASTALIKGAAKVGMKAGQALGQAASSAASDYSAGRGARRGVLAPGYPPPPPNAGGSYYDFRGVLSLRKVPPEYQAAESPWPVHRPGQGAAPANRAAVRCARDLCCGRAPTGSGKTTSIIVPWIVAGLRAGWSVVAIDAKGDLAICANTERASGQRLGVPIQALDYTHRSPR